MMRGRRKVAVKCLLRQFFELARKRISLLVKLDEKSRHVVRYFAIEEGSDVPLWLLNSVPYLLLNV